MPNVISDITASGGSSDSFSGAYTAAFAKLLAARGISTSEQASDFLRRDMLFSESPFDILGMDSAVGLLRGALKSSRRVYVFSDSDLDGLTSLTIVRNLFDRVALDYHFGFPCGNERFGLNRRAVEEAAEKGCEIILTLDCGIRDNDVVEYASALGIDVIICDHHDPSEDLPRAVIVNPKIEESVYPFRELAGCGVALLLCAAFLYSFLPVYGKDVCLIEDSKITLFRNLSPIREMEFSEDISGMIRVHSCAFEGEYSRNDVSLPALFSIALSNVKTHCPEIYSEYMKISDRRTRFIFSSLMSSKKIASFFMENCVFSSLGTIADVVPLSTANRSIVFMGLNMFAASKLPQIAKLRIPGKIPDSRFISWNVAPLLNSPGRFGESRLTADFLYGVNTDAVYEKITSINRMRKSKLKNAVESSDKYIDDSYGNIVLFYSEDVPEGITGIIAARISEGYRKPAIAAVRVEDNVIKASARCLSGKDILSTAEKHSAMFLRFGGHPSAFGFSISADDFRDFLSKFDKEVPSVEDEETKLKYDCVICDSEITLSFADEISMLEPFGKGNEEPLFICKNVIPDEYQNFGLHAKIRAKSGTEFIGWKMKEILKEVYGRESSDLIVKIEKNIFNGRVSVRAIIEQIA